MIFVEKRLENQKNLKVFKFFLQSLELSKSLIPKRRLITQKTNVTRVKLIIYVLN